MAATQQPPTSPQPGATPCANCGAPLAPDQRYCLSCGTRRGDPRVPAAAAAPGAVAVEPAPRPADVSPLAAVIGIALLGGMLLIGVLIGRETGNDEPAPAPVVQVGEAAPGESTPPAPTEEPQDAGDDAGDVAAAVVSEWPEGTDGFTIQLSSLPKSEATQESVESAKQGAVDQGAADAAVLDSDLYSSLPTGQFIIYSGVYTDRKSADVGLKALGENFAGASVVEVSDGDASAPDDAPPANGGAVEPVTPGEGERSGGGGGKQK